MMGTYGPGLTNRSEKLEEGDPKRLLHNRSAKSLLLEDLQKAARNELGMTDAEKRAYADEAARGANATADVQTKQLGQMALATGPQYSAQYGMAARKIAEQQRREGTAMAQAEAERISTAKALQEKERVWGELARQQELRNQRTQFWSSLLFGTLGQIGGSALQNTAITSMGGAAFGAEEGATAIPKLAGAAAI